MANKKEKLADNAQLGGIKKDFFLDMAEEPIAGKKAEFLFSTDALSGYGLDLVFELVQEAGFDGIDLAVWKNFDSLNVNYVKKLSEKHNFPVKVIQTSDNLNDTEITRAIDLCYALGADTIAINAPTFFNMKAFNFITDNISHWRSEHKDIHFTIINPEDANLFALPIPTYHFSNMMEVIRKYLCYLGLDVANMDAGVLEGEFMKKLKDFVPYISVVYLSDKNKAGEGHILPGEGMLKLPVFLGKLKEAGYHRYISGKIYITKNELADAERVKMMMKKLRKYLEENYENI